MTEHVINFTDVNGKSVKRSYRSTDSYIRGLKRELRKIAIRRAVTTDSAEIKRMNHNEQLFRNLLAFEDEKTEVGKRFQKIYFG